jgi:hypothetical protein
MRRAGKAQLFSKHREASELDAVPWPDPAEADLSDLMYLFRRIKPQRIPTNCHQRYTMQTAEQTSEVLPARTYRRGSNTTMETEILATSRQEQILPERFTFHPAACV